MKEINTKTAFISIVGCPNVGKSSLLNVMLGQKIAIVSDKPQTTRTKIMGVLTEDDVQLVFTDTPGYHRPRTKLGEKMVKAVSDSISGVDACLFVVEPSGELRENEKELIEKFKKQKMPVILAINKIDTMQKKEDLALRIAQLSKLYEFNAIVPVSAV
ncbi:MAG: GTPase Era, partial [Oscillospiraceae bacterium]